MSASATRSRTLTSARNPSSSSSLARVRNSVAFRPAPVLGDVRDDPSASSLIRARSSHALASASRLSRSPAMITLDANADVPSSIPSARRADARTPPSRPPRARGRANAARVDHDPSPTSFRDCAARAARSRRRLAVSAPRTRTRQPANHHPATTRLATSRRRGDASSASRRRLAATAARHASIALRLGTTIRVASSDATRLAVSVAAARATPRHARRHLDAGSRRTARSIVSARDARGRLQNAPPGFRAVAAPSPPNARRAARVILAPRASASARDSPARNPRRIASRASRPARRLRVAATVASRRHVAIARAAIRASRARVASASARRRDATTPRHLTHAPRRRASRRLGASLATVSASRVFPASTATRHARFATRRSARRRRASARASRADASAAGARRLARLPRDPRVSRLPLDARGGAPRAEEARAGLSRRVSRVDVGGVSPRRGSKRVATSRGGVASRASRGGPRAPRHHRVARETVEERAARGETREDERGA